MAAISSRSFVVVLLCVALPWSSSIPTLKFKTTYPTAAINNGFFKHYGDYKDDNLAKYTGQNSVNRPIDMCVMDKGETKMFIAAYSNSDPFFTRSSGGTARNSETYEAVDNTSENDISGQLVSTVSFAVVDMFTGDVLWHTREHLPNVAANSWIVKPYITFVRCDTATGDVTYGGAANPKAPSSIDTTDGYNVYTPDHNLFVNFVGSSSDEWYGFARTITHSGGNTWALSAQMELKDDKSPISAERRRSVVADAAVIADVCATHKAPSCYTKPGLGGCVHSRQSCLINNLRGDPEHTMKIFLVNRYNGDTQAQNSVNNRNWSPYLVVTMPNTYDNVTRLDEGLDGMYPWGHNDFEIGTSCYTAEACANCDCTTDYSGGAHRYRDLPEIGHAIAIGDQDLSQKWFGTYRVSTLRTTVWVAGEAYFANLHGGKWVPFLTYVDVLWAPYLGDPALFGPNTAAITMEGPGNERGPQFSFCKYYPFLSPVDYSLGSGVAGKRLHTHSLKYVKGTAASSLYLYGTYNNVIQPNTGWYGLALPSGSWTKGNLALLKLKPDYLYGSTALQNNCVRNSTGTLAASNFGVDRKYLAKIHTEALVEWARDIGSTGDEGLIVPRQLNTNAAQGPYAQAPCKLHKNDVTTEDCGNAVNGDYGMKYPNFWKGATANSIAIFSSRLDGVKEIWGVGYSKNGDLDGSLGPMEAGQSGLDLILWKVNENNGDFEQMHYPGRSQSYLNVIHATSRGVFYMGEAEGEIASASTLLYKGGKDIIFAKHFHCASGQSPFDGFFVECAACPPGLYGLTEYGLSKCQLCQPGSFSSVAGSGECTLCPPGFYADGPASGFCKECPVGYQSEAAGGIVCSFCSTGQFSTGGEPCQFCPPNTYQDEAAQGQCKMCPLQTSSGFGAMGIDFCACLDIEFGTPFGPAPITPCRECPEVGSICSPGMHWPEAEAGYWMSSTDYTDLKECSPARACPGGIEECSTGYEGDGCNECTFGYYREMGVCLPCPAVDNRIVLLIGSVLFFVVLTILSCCGVCGWLILGKRLIIVYYLYKRLKGVIRVLSMQLAYIQVLMSLFTLGMDIPNIVDFTLALNGLIPFDLNLGFGKPECSSEAIHYGHKFIVKISWPVLFAIFGTIVAAFIALILGQFFVAIDRRRSKLEKKEQTLTMYGVMEWFILWWGGLVLNLINILLFSLLSMAMDPFRCIKIDATTWSMVSEASVICFSSDPKWTLSVPFALTAMIVYGGVYPFLMCMVVILHRKKASRQPDRIQYRMFYWLWEKYEEKYFYWELVVIMKKWFMVGTLLFASQGPAEQAFLLYIVNLFFMAFTVYSQPYIFWQDDAIDSIASTVIMIAVVGAICIDSKTMTTWDDLGVAFFIVVLITIQLVALIGLLIDVTIMNLREWKRQQKKEVTEAEERIEAERKEPIPIQLNLKDNTKILNSHKSVFRKRDGTNYFIRMSWQGTNREFASVRDKFLTHFCYMALAFSGTSKLRKYKMSESQEELVNIVISIKEDTWLHNVVIGWRLDHLAVKGELNLSQAMTNPDQTFDVSYLKVSVPEGENYEKTVYCSIKFTCRDEYIMGTDTTFPDLKEFFEADLDKLVSPGLVGPDVYVSHIDDVSKGNDEPPSCVCYFKMGTMAAWRIEAACAASVLDVGKESTPENPQPIPQWYATSKLRLVKKSDFPDDDAAHATAAEAKAAREEARRKAREATMYDSKKYEEEVRQKVAVEKEDYMAQNELELRRQGESEEKARRKSILTEYGMDFLENKMNDDLLTSDPAPEERKADSDAGSSRRGPRGALKLQGDYGKMMDKNKINKLIDS